MTTNNHKHSSKPLVIHIITKLELGGAQRVTLDTLRYLNKAKFETGFISGSEGELSGEALKLIDCDVRLIPQLVHPIRPVKDILAFFHILKILKHTRPVIVHTHSSKAGLIGRWAAFFSRVPVRVHSVHGWSFNDYQNPLKKHLFLFFEKISAPITSFFFLENRRHISVGKNHKILKEGRYSLLPPGIDFTEFDSFRNKKGKLPSTEPISSVRKSGKMIITMVACFKQQKAPLDFIKAAAIVKNKLGGCSFFLAGDGILRGNIELEIMSNDLQKDVYLLGWRRDIPLLMALSDVIVLTSLWEGMPTVLPMAMRLGIPVVANRIDGCEELIVEGVNGLLSEPGNPQSIAENTITACINKALREKIRKNSYKYTLDFEIEKAVSKQEEIYKNLLQAK